ncbi:sensor histidine kinase [Rubrivivax rivuli]|uniref:Sensor histidine kinase n=1 Tax=Rubrivivax rivuli TaxID=1862385 RepID=A0A437RCV0_9BURK|nr:histidine kinase [Rubrivivax rivuli]RVU44573.1 sensor histidine kinase [Rubrivivax rivuli]
MQNFIATLRLARQDFFKLKRRHAAPEWALWVMTGLVALCWGGALSLVALVASRRVPTLTQVYEVALPLMLTSLIIGVVFHIVYTAIERLASDRFLVWVNGEPGVLVGLFYGVTSMACVGLGFLLAYLLLGQVPGMGRVDWAPRSSWISVSIFAVFASVVWGLWAWQQWHEEQLKRQAQEAQLRLLQAQIEPHFLFNTLANVQSLMDHDLPKAKQMLGSFTDYLRASLGQMRSEHSTVGQELELAQRYLQLLQGRMEDRLRFEISADEAARAQRLPPLLLQPLVENAVMHGLEPSIEGGTVQVRAQLQGGTLRLEVQDDGLGLNAPARPGARRGNGVALSNIRERLQARFGPEARLELQAAAPQGTLARITIPLHPELAAP